MAIGDKLAGSGEVDISLHPQTLDEAIEWWDEGRSLFSVELGGLGPGYEQAIQITGIELIRQFKDTKIDWEKEEQVEQVNQDMNDYGHSCEVMKKLGLSGAQFGAAKNMACLFIRQGWENGMNLAPKDRHIQISKNFPG